MTVTVDGQEKRVGLALSGGGFRAAAFHLGVFRKLRELGLLWKLDLISCVSGGSIAGAYLARHWGDDGALDRLDNYLRTTSVAVSSAIGGLLDPFNTRLDKLRNTYELDLFGDTTLGEMPPGPRLYLNATNMATGNMFFFVCGGGGRAEMGEWELGQTSAHKFRLSKAVAASSAFPPVFPPLRLDQEDYPSPGVDYVTLSDGGVYDNLGANPLFRSRNALDYALVSDAGSIQPLLAVAEEAGDARVRVAALDAATRFPLSEDAWRECASAIRRVVFDEPEGSAARRTALAMAVRIPLASVRSGLRSLAETSSDPDRDVVQAGLERAGDPSRIAPLLARAEAGKSLKRLLPDSAPMAQQALAYLLSYNEVSSVIPGMHSLEQLAINISAAGQPMDHITRGAIEHYWDQLTQNGQRLLPW